MFGILDPIRTQKMVLTDHKRGKKDPSFIIFQTHKNLFILCVQRQSAQLHQEGHCAEPSFKKFFETLQQSSHYNKTAWRTFLFLKAFGRSHAANLKINSGIVCLTACGTDEPASRRRSSTAQTMPVYIFFHSGKKGFWIDFVDLARLTTGRAINCLGKRLYFVL